MTTAVVPKKRIDSNELRDLTAGGILASASACLLALVFFGERKDAQAEVVAPTTLAAAPASQEAVARPEEVTPAPEEVEEATAVPPGPQIPVRIPGGPFVPVVNEPIPETSTKNLGQKGGCVSDACLKLPKDGPRVRSCGKPVLDLVPPDMPKAVLDQFVAETLRAVCPTDGSVLPAHYKDQEHPQIGKLKYPDGREVTIDWFIK